jgi:putative ABC transport system permease protein
MNGFLTVLLGAFVFVYAVLAVIVLRQPLIGRIALREVMRHRGQTAILVVALMVTGAAIFAVQVTVDSGIAGFTATDLAAWGRDDIEITAGGSPFDAGLASRLAADPQVAQNAAAVQNAVTLRASVIDLDRNLGKPGVQIVGLDLASQGRFGAFVLSNGRRSSGSELTAGRIFISQPLADALGAKVGDRMQVTGLGAASSGPLVIGGVTQRTEAGAYGDDRSIFSSLETAQQVAGISQVNLVRISAHGDGDAEIKRASGMVDRLRASTSGTSLVVVEPKRALLEADLAAASVARVVFTSLSLVVGLVATLMVVNLAVMVAEERRPLLAVLRALGLTRSGLVKVAVVEGGIYSLGGSLAGLPLGLAIGAVAVSIMQPFVPGTHLSVDPSSLLSSVAAATLITLTTLFITSLRTSSMAISAAIRDLPDPSMARRGSWVRLVLLGTGALIGAALLAWGGAAERVVGGAVVISCAGGFIRGRLSDRIRFTAIGAAIAAWAVGYVSSSVRTWVPADQVFGAFIGLIVAVAGISILAASQLRLLEYVASFPGGRGSGLQATLRPALAYTSRRPLRSGLVIAAFALVVALLATAAASINRPNYAHDSGGFDVRVTEVGSSQLTLPPDVQRNISKQATLASRTFLGPVRTLASGPQGNTDWQVLPVTVFGLTDEQITSGIMPLTSMDSKYHSDAEVWQAMVRDPSLVIASPAVGSELDLATAKGTLRLHVVAQQGSGNAAASIIDGVVASQKVFDWMSASPPGVVLLLRAAPGVTPRALADQVQRATLSDGADATTTRQILDAQYADGQLFVNLLLAPLRAGMLVGLFGLGTIALRAVVERRRAIGVLRAIGFGPGQVLVGVLLETVLIATAGVAVGIAAAYAMGTSLTGPAFGNTSGFAPDLGTLLPAVGIVYAAVLLVTLLPAIRASRLRPAEALRTVA